MIPADTLQATHPAATPGSPLVALAAPDSAAAEQYRVLYQRLARLAARRSMRIVAVTSASRVEVLPELSTVGDFLPGYEASQWYGIGAPRNTPAEIIDKLNKEINAGLVDPRMKARFADIGGTVLPGSPADFGKLIAEETEKWGKVIRAANIKAE